MTKEIKPGDVFTCQCNKADVGVKFAFDDVDCSKLIVIQCLLFSVTASLIIILGDALLVTKTPGVGLFH